MLSRYTNGEETHSNSGAPTQAVDVDNHNQTSNFKYLLGKGKISLILTALIIKNKSPRSFRNHKILRSKFLVTYF